MKTYHKNPENVNEKWKEYGNNYFYLKVIVGDSYYYLDAVTQEIPAVSFSGEWEDSPAASMGDTIDKFVNSEFLEFINQRVGESSYRHYGLAGSLTSRTYKTGSKPSFNLKFRCYTGQQIGAHPLSSPQLWIGLLSMTTPLNSQNVMHSGSDFAADLLKNVVDSGEALYNWLKDTVNGDKKDDKAVNLSTLSDEVNNGIEIKPGEKKVDYAKLDVDKFNSNNEISTKTKTKIVNELTDDAGNTNDIANEANKNLINNDNSMKMSNTSIYGANIFELRILPFIFEKPFTVIVKSWTVTPSREWNYDTNDHYYYDFSISTEMDILPSCQTMMGLMKKYF